jgi:hypothetical protein
MAALPSVILPSAFLIGAVLARLIPTVCATGRSRQEPADLYRDQPEPAGRTTSPFRCPLINTERNGQVFARGVASKLQR